LLGALILHSLEYQYRSIKSNGFQMRENPLNRNINTIFLSIDYVQGKTDGRNECNSNNKNNSMTIISEYMSDSMSHD
jgi:hypothetical protein